MGYYREYDKKTLDKLHKVELEMLDKFKEICDKYHFNYSLASGTLLGAIRHKGFIPWDDDVDVLMPRPEYEEFLKVAPKKLGDKYFLDCFEYNEDYHLQFAKIKKNGTIFDEEKAHHMNNHKGIFIDIFPEEVLYDNVKKSYYIAVISRIIGSTVNVKCKICKIKDTRHKIAVAILSLLPQKTLMRFQRKIVTTNKNKESNYYGCYFGVYPFMHEVIKKEDFLPTIEVTFEGKKYKAMNNYDSYLSNLYGDYMKLPPKEKRVNHMPLKIDFGEDNEN